MSIAPWCIHSRHRCTNAPVQPCEPMIIDILIQHVNTYHNYSIIDHWSYIYIYIRIYPCVLSSLFVCFYVSIGGETGSHLMVYRYTSSTAQGGGGRFKNRKPIGEVGCCESRMAERIHWWTEVVGVVFFGVVAMVAVVTWPQLLDVAWCSAVAVVVVVWCSGVIVVMCNECSAVAVVVVAVVWCN